MALAATSTACAMSEVPVPGDWCQVHGGEKLPAESGGGAALCAAIGRALPPVGNDERLTVTVRVEKRSRLSATVTLADGRTLPPLRMAQTDRPISRATLERFGAAIAEQIADTGR